MSYRTVHTAVTPHDSTDNLSEVMDYLYVGVSGNIALVDAFSSAVTYSNVPAGTKLFGAWRRINSTNTTATGLVMVARA